ncbi:MAG: dihydroorotase [Sphingobacteriales bacterium]|jgi:dihydroorotase
MAKWIIKHALVVNEGKTLPLDVLIDGERIAKIALHIETPEGAIEIDGTGKILIPGLIDDQVHFREPGLTQKADIGTESIAAVAGGITSYMEMPNTTPQAVTQELLEDKYKIAAVKSLANYSFFMGATNDNFAEVAKTNPKNVCGVKVFMGSSTGNMLVDEAATLEKIFASTDLLIATHCESEEIIQANIEKYKETYGEDVPMSCHPLIRSAEACYASSSMAVKLAKKHNTRLHILHISTAKELSLFRNDIPLREKRITAEACIHHLWFEDSAYETHGSKIKWNPAVKSKKDRDAILAAVNDNRIDVIATDHAPHTLAEKEQSYFKAPSGGPLVQHALLALLDLFHEEKLTLEKIVEKACHAPADLFQIKDRGYIKEGYYADLVLADLKKPYTVSQQNILYKCRWSPFEGHTFHSSVINTFVNGNLVYNRGKINLETKGMRLQFDR